MPSSAIPRGGRGTALERGCGSLVPSRRPPKGFAPSLAISNRDAFPTGISSRRRVTCAGGFGSRRLSRLPTYACVNGRSDFADRYRAARLSPLRLHAGLRDVRNERHGAPQCLTRRTTENFGEKTP